MHPIDTLFDWFLSATLRGTLLICAVLLVQLALGRRLPAVWRHALWLPVLFVLGSPFLPQSPFSVENGWTAPESAPVVVAAEPDARTGTAPVFSSEPADVRTSIDGRALAACIWFAGAIIVLLAGVIACLRTLAVFRQSSRPLPDRLQAEIVAAARSRGLRRVPRVLLSEKVPGPAMTGLIRPLLLLPADFEEAFDREERRLILLHELTHVKRGDLLVNGLVVLLQALHWCNPLVWFAFDRFRADRELACDSAVLAMNRGDDRSRYGHALLKVESAMAPAAWRLGFLGLVGLFGRGRLLSSRITAIAGHHRAHPFWNLAGPGLLLTVGLVGATRAQNEAIAERGPQIVIESRFIEVPADQAVTFTSAQVTLDPKQAVSAVQGDADVIKQLTSIPGADVLSSPTVLTTSGQKATVEIGAPKPDASGKPKFVGTRLEVLPTLADDKIRLKLHVQRTQQIAAGGNATFSEREIKSDLTAAPGDTLVISAGEKTDPGTAPARRLFIAVTARFADDAALVRARLEKIIIPSIEFNEAKLSDALAFLRAKARELDPEKRGINLLHIPAEGAPEPHLTVSFKQIPLSEALKYLAALANLEVEFGDPVVVLRAPSGTAHTEAASAPATPSGKSAALAENIVLPQLELVETPLTDVLQYFQKKSLDLDPAKQGLNFVLNAPGHPAPDQIQITLTLRNVPLSEALRYVAELANLKLRYDEDAVVFFRQLANDDR